MFWNVCLANELDPQPSGERTRLVKTAQKRGLVGQTLERLGSTHPDEASTVRNLIHKTIPQLEIQRVRTVKNCFLEAMYLLKKEECKVRHGKVEEMLLIHVTSASVVKFIITDNFDWRKVTRGRFGMGTSFSSDAAYANTYANNNIGEVRAFIITKVLVSKPSQMVIFKGQMPPVDFDTNVAVNNSVYVKFYDNEILPRYVVFYKNLETSVNLLQIQNKSKANPCPMRKKLSLGDDTEDGESSDESSDEDHRFSSMQRGNRQDEDSSDDTSDSE